jgi:Ner family transcriptional regulator
MHVSNTPKKTAEADWHRADIVAALHKAGWSLRELSRQSGYGPGTLTQALSRPYPKGEAIIASALNMKAEDIWPTRYAKRNFTPVLTTSLRSSGPRRVANAAAIG